MCAFRLSGTGVAMPEGKFAIGGKFAANGRHRTSAMPSDPNPLARPALHAYRRRQGWLAAVLAVQLVGGLAVLPAPGHEVFPVFSWFLFALTPPAERTAPELRVAELGGRTFDPPVRLETERSLVRAADAPTVVRLAKDLRAALAAGDTAALARARRTLEENFLTGRGPGRYALVEVTHDPVARLRGGAARERVVREFTIGEP
jgi:hypothetical protein